MKNKKTMKRVLAVAAAIPLAFTLAACSDSGTEPVEEVDVVEETNGDVVEEEEVVEEDE